MAQRTIVVGGGLSGLATAVWIAKEGHPVTLFEGSRTLGGRARSRGESGYVLNQGPHALYRGGPAEQVLDALGVSYVGRAASMRGALGLTEHALVPFPAGPSSLMRCNALSLGSKVALGTWLASLGVIDTEGLRRRSVSEWLNQALARPDARRLAEAFVRLATYVNAPRELSASVAVRQLRRGADPGVTYVDGGWQTLVDGLVRRGHEAGVRFETGVRVTQRQREQDGHRVSTDGGHSLWADAVVLATDPASARALAPGTTLAEFGARARSVRVAALDVSLTGLPLPERPFVLGIDRPLYVADHGMTARLAPEGGAVVHAAKYLFSDPGSISEPRTDREELEGALDRIQPGWRGRVVESRFLPRMPVIDALPTAVDGGLEGRPGATVAEVPGLFAAGDWVSSAGILADGSLGAAREAARAVLDHFRSPGSREAA
jgi:phytoene dehydrogenase-like protein